MAQDEPQQLGRLKVDRSNVPRSPSFFDVYANDTYVQTSPWDVRFMFGVITELTPSQTESGIQRIGDVRVSIHMAKKIAQILAKQIETYEAEHGVLSVPE